MGAEPIRSVRRFELTRVTVGRFGIDCTRLLPPGSHAGWSEITAYSECNRQFLTLGSVSGGSANNAASKATSSINGTATVAGAFLTTNNTKSGTTGTLVGATDFGSARSVESGDSLQVTVTPSLTAS